MEVNPNRPSDDVLVRRYVEDILTGRWRLLNPDGTPVQVTGSYCTKHEGPGGRPCPIHTDGDCP